MQKIFLTPMQTFLMDVISWIFFHLSIGFLSTKIPHAWMSPNLRFFMSYAWEKNGEIYEKLFHVRAWKDLVPDGSRMYHESFSIKHLPTNDPEYLIFWLKESIRAELCHWAMIVPGFIFFLWNDVFFRLVDGALRFSEQPCAHHHAAFQPAAYAQVDRAAREKPACEEPGNGPGPNNTPGLNPPVQRRNFL